MYAEAIADVKKAMALIGDDPTVMTELGFAYGLAGQKAEAQKLLNNLRERSTPEYIDAAQIALLYIAIGDKDQAFTSLNKAYAGRFSWMTWLKVEPKFDS